VAEGDTIHRAARALEKALGGRAITGVEVPNPRSPLRRQGSRVDELRGATMERAEARGKHLLLHFDHGLVLHSHLGMRGSWRVSAGGARLDRRAWVVLSAGTAQAVERDGSHLELRTEPELRSDPRLRSLGPDVLAADFDAPTGVAALRAARQGREIGEALLDQRVLAGIGNIYKCEGCWSARIDPWRPLSDLDDDELRRVVIEIGGLMRYGVERGRTPRSIYRRSGQPCPRCGTPISSRGQGDANRTTYWCGACQGADTARRGHNRRVEEKG
jgi:endonuclease VIII